MAMAVTAMAIIRTLTTKSPLAPPLPHKHLSRGGFQKPLARRFPASSPVAKHPVQPALNQINRMRGATGMMLTSRAGKDGDIPAGLGQTGFGRTEKSRDAVPLKITCGMAESSSSRQQRWSLEGTTALVTGGAKGIGRAIVEELAGLGASVYTCDRTEKDLNESLAQWKDAGLHVGGFLCDIVSRSAREELIEKVSTFCNGKLNMLINNVGTNRRKPSTLDYTADDISFIMSTNFESAYHLCQISHPLLKASGNGSIVFTSSIAGIVAVQSGTLYAASKGAVNQLTKNLACEWASDKIRVNSVAPWYTRTSLVEKLLEDKKAFENILEHTPLRRLAEPHEVASLAAFLCLPTAGYITGQVISIDGGMTINGLYTK